MTPELWQRLKPLFDAVLREGAESRAAFIDTVCSDDLDLKVHLKRLLDAEQQDTGLRNASLADLNRFLDDKGFLIPPGELLAGTHVVIPMVGKTMADDLDKNFPEDTLVQFNYLPSVQARLALNKGDASGAIKSLEAATSYELGVSRATDLNWNAMIPVFVRGEAYLGSHQGSEAATEFQKILDHRGLVLNLPIGALAHLGLGRAYVLQGDTAKAKAAYQDFLTLWKDADPDIPVLQQAKAEYAKLQ